MQKIRFYLETLLFKFLLVSIEKMTLKMAYKVGYVLALANLHILKIRVDVAKKQLHAAYPHKTPEQITAMVKQVFVNLGMTAVEFCWFAFKNLPEKEKFISYEGYNNINKALEQDKGLIVFMGHFGNWELAGQVLAQKTNKLVAVARKQKNPYFTKLVNDIRSFNKIHIIRKKLALRGIAEALKSNKIVGILGDQAARKKYLRIKFFGKKAATYMGTAKIALKYQCPVIFASLTRRKKFQFKYKFSSPINFTSETSESEQIEEFTRMLTEMLEQEVRKFPEQWFWVHRRWKR